MNGIEWVVDAQGCSSESLQDLERLRRLFDTLILDLHLRPVGATQWHQFPGSGGITGLCLLSESHLTCHTFPEHGSLCLNVFCCVPRSRWDFELHLSSLFLATAVRVSTIEREYSAPANMSEAISTAA